MCESPFINVPNVYPDSMISSTYPEHRTEEIEKLAGVQMLRIDEKNRTSGHSAVNVFAYSTSPLDENCFLSNGTNFFNSVKNDVSLF